VIERGKEKLYASLTQHWIKFIRTVTDTQGGSSFLRTC